MSFAKHNLATRSRMTVTSLLYVFATDRTRQGRDLVPALLASEMPAAFVRCPKTAHQTSHAKSASTVKTTAYSIHPLTSLLASWPPPTSRATLSEVFMATLA